LQEGLVGDADAAFALDRLDQEAGSLRADRRLGRFQIVELDITEAGQQGQKALVHLVLVRRADGAERTAVEGVVESDDLEPIGPGRLVIGTRGLDRALHRLRT